MGRRQNPDSVPPARPRWFWIVAGVLSISAAAVVFTDSTLTVQADAPLARPMATLPPAPPSSLMIARRPAVRPAIPSEALHGLATWYGEMRDGHWTASGERFDMMAMTAAHKTLPFGTLLRVVDLKTSKSVVVRVNDRGQLPANHVIDLSYAAAEELGIVKSGVAQVRLEVISLGKNGKRQPAPSAPAAPAPASPAPTPEPATGSAQ
jgi:rare lipoprotein A